MMQKPFLTLKCCAVLIAAISGASIPAIASADWTITSLGTLGGSLSVAMGINNSGQVTGWSTVTGYSNSSAFITGPNGAGMTSLGFNGNPWGINDSGQVAGAFYVGISPRAFLYSNGVMTDLGTLGGSESMALDINNSGQVVGYSFNASNTTQRAFLYSTGQ